MTGESSTGLHFNVIIAVFFSIVAILLFLTACTKLLDVYDLVPGEKCQDMEFRNQLALTINNLKDGEISPLILVSVDSGCMLKTFFPKSSPVRPTSCNLDIPCLCLCEDGDDECKDGSCVNLNFDPIEGDPGIEGDRDLIKEGNLLLKSGVKNIYISKKDNKLFITKTVKIIDPNKF